MGWIIEPALFLKGCAVLAGILFAIYALFLIINDTRKERAYQEFSNFVWATCLAEIERKKKEEEKNKQLKF